MFKKSLFIFLSLISSFACACEKHDNHTSDWIKISDAKVLANIPGQQQTAAYMTISNLSDKPLALKNIHSDAAKKIELHEQVMVDGLMRMRKAEPMNIPAGKSVSLKAGGLHFMLLELTSNLKAGETVELKLCFNQGCAISNAKIVDVREQDQQHNHHHHH